MPGKDSFPASNTDLPFTREIVSPEAAKEWTKVNRSFFFARLLTKEKISFCTNEKSQILVSNLSTEAGVFEAGGYRSLPEYSNLPSFELAEQVLNLYEKAKGNDLTLLCDEIDASEIACLKVIGFKDLEGDAQPSLQLPSETLEHLEAIQASLRKEFHNLFTELRYRSFHNNLLYLNSLSKERMQESLEHVDVDIEVGNSPSYVDSREFQRYQLSVLSTFISNYGGEIDYKSFILGLRTVVSRQINSTQALCWKFEKGILVERGPQYCIQSLELLFLCFRFSLVAETDKNIALILDPQLSNYKLGRLLQYFPKEKNPTFITAGEVTESSEVVRINIEGVLDAEQSVLDYAKDFITDRCSIL
mmetsp:Transcript_8086/g.9244  ORF Transcript_8086/g.9244 Transcript_8086/m.9244 type:complete len:361 (-) Transcript_8086:103-1185(-)